MFRSCHRMMPATLLVLAGLVATTPAEAASGLVAKGTAPPLSRPLIHQVQCLPGGGGCAQWGWCWRNIWPGGKPFMCCKRQCR